MTTRPILFSAPMVRALLDGSKRQTRRILKADRMQHDACVRWDGDSWLLERYPVQERMSSNFGRCDRIKCPYGQVGDMLWVKETFAYDVADHFGKESEAAVYRATTDCDDYFKGQWTPSIFMPRRLSRITLEITDVRVEKLNAISEEDAKEEGVTQCEGGYWNYIAGEPYQGMTALQSYETLWEQINGPGSWALNPWVWALSFRRITP